MPLIENKTLHFIQIISNRDQCKGLFSMKIRKILQIASSDLAYRILTLIIYMEYVMFLFLKKNIHIFWVLFYQTAHV